MKRKNKKMVNNDTQIVSREQYNEDKNLPHIPESEDTIGLKSPEMQGEESVSGEMPDPESGDDTLMNAHAMGQQLGEDLEHPQPLDIAGDIEKAEKAFKES